MDELLEHFLIETRDLVTQANKDLARLAVAPQDKPAIDSAFRALHTLKGSFAIFGLTPAEVLLHGAEDVLEQARKGSSFLNAAMIRHLVACLDQTDRWIDEMERDSALSASAQHQADLILARFATDAPAPAAPDLSARESAAPDWLTVLLEREAGIIASAQTSLTAFRYRPDEDCFFRGEDPLAVVDAIPQLMALAILPRGGAWPSALDLEPFSCFLVIEGLSAASEQEIRAGFRLQPDQVDFAPVPPQAASANSFDTQRESQMLRVESARVDALADGLRDLVVATNRIAPLVRELETGDRDHLARLRAIQSDLERITGGLHNQLTRIRLVSLEPTFRRLPRAARDMAEALGKEVVFTLKGSEIEADKQIADALFEPLLHLLRNAIDHGIERPEVRRAAKKLPQGQIDLTLRRDGDAIHLVIADDGAGIDPTHIRQTAVARGIIAAEAAQALDDRTALRLILRPGFSTSDTITDLSGRGVGMDAVQAAVARLRGTIEIESIPGSGTRFILRLPAHALTTRLLIVRVSGERFGLSLDQVIETLRVEASAIRPAGTGQVVVLRGKAIPVLDLADLLDLPPNSDPQARLVISRVQGGLVALRIGDFAERIDTVLRAPRGMLSLVRGVMGSALLGDGSVLLVLDLPELMA